MKRLFDLLLSFGLLLILALPLLLLWGLVRCKLGSPVLFRQVRPGLHGRPFMMVKFRTMTDERGADGELLPDAQRLTSFGRFLRATSLDELPELWNVLRGEMSLVGPRPIVTAEIPRYGRWFAYYCAVKPGVTGLWQVNGRNDVSYRRRVALDVLYARTVGVRRYIRIMAATVPAVLLRSGSY